MLTSVHTCIHSLLLRFIDDEFDPEQTLTIGVDFKTKIVNVDGSNVKLGNYHYNNEYIILHSIRFDNFIIFLFVIFKLKKNSMLGYGWSRAISNVNTKLLSVNMIFVYYVYTTTVYFITTVYFHSFQRNKSIVTHQINLFIN